MSDFLSVLSKDKINNIPLYCTGFPEHEFVEQYANLYDILPETNSNLILKEKNHKKVISSKNIESIVYNIIGTYNLLEWMRTKSSQAKLILVGTCMVYDTVANEPISEKSKLNPRSSC